MDHHSFECSHFSTRIENGHAATRSDTPQMHMWLTTVCALVKYSWQWLTFGLVLPVKKNRSAMTNGFGSKYSMRSPFNWSHILVAGKSRWVRLLNRMYVGLPIQLSSTATRLSEDTAFTVRYNSTFSRYADMVSALLLNSPTLLNVAFGKIPSSPLL